MIRTVRLAAHQLHLEQRAFWRNPQSAFFTFVLPIGLVVIFGAMQAGETVPGRPGTSALTLLIPGFLAFGLIIAAYGNLAATIAALRCDGVLKRVRATPLQPAVYLSGHLSNVLAVTGMMAAITITIGAVAFDVAPRLDGAPLLAASLTLGVVCFASLGLAISAVIPTADAAGPITNGTYVPLAIISGTFSYDLSLPTWLDTTVRALPVRAFTDALRAGYNPEIHNTPTDAFVVLAIWAAIGTTLALKYFRWNP